MDRKIDTIGRQMHEMMAELYPICRSITGDGVRQTLQHLQDTIPLAIHEVATGTPVFDWSVPQEWNIRDAYLKNTRGEKIIDFDNSNLHVVNYSRPIHTTVSLAELKEHLFSLPDHPSWIPYRTSYYSDNWGLCLSHEQLMSLQDSEYEVCIDASLTDGHLTYGEYYLPGESTDEVLLSCHVCHPSLANDNLSGIALVTFLAQSLQAFSRRYSYRFLFIPGTIGSITWLALNEAHVSRIKHGFVAAGVGDSGHFAYKKSRRGDADIDHAFGHVLAYAERAGHAGHTKNGLIDFFPYGYDERQFCSPGFNLPIGCVMRTPHGQYPEYHTSADNLDFVRPEALADSFNTCWDVLSVLEGNRIYINQNPKCEPQLGKRGLYKTIGGQADSELNQMALLWVLNMSDGHHSLFDIAQRAELSFATVRTAANALLECDLLKEADISCEESGHSRSTA